MSDDDDTSRFSRRTFMKGVGLTAAAAALGTTPASAAHPIDFRFLNWRAVEARKVWDRGYRGRRDRTLALTDSGVEARHPDLGPWNGVTAKIVDDGDGGQELKLFERTGDIPAEPGSADSRDGLSGPKDVDEVDVFADPSNKTFGWFNRDSRYGSYQKPRDGNGHGTHVSSIMAGSGRASTIDSENTTVDEPNATLLPGDFREYTVEAEAGESVFASAFGDNVNVYIVDAETGEELDQSPVRKDSIIVEQPVEAGTYTVQVRPRETEPATTGVGEQATAGTPTAGTLDRIAYGTTLATETTGDATVLGEGVPGDESSGQFSLHPGVAPNAGIVGLQGLSDPTVALGNYADTFTEAFNVRSVNMSWGPLQGVPLGQVDGLGNRADVRRITEGGILVVASAGNSFTPANGNGGPAAADEAISVVATDPFDGISSYSSGGIGGLDEQSDESAEDSPLYLKPDVTAPGGDVGPDSAALIGVGTATGTVGGAAPLPAGVGYPVPSNFELARAARNGDPTGEDSVVPRDYTDKAGTSMSSPYTNGVAGLLAEAMEFGPAGRPEALTLPEPAATEEDDVYRLKGLLLATASETAFTAAPYHLGQNPGKAPTYDFGGRDPFEGYGRVNPDAAVDAVTRDLTPDLTEQEDGTRTGSATTEETLGLYVPEDSRATAGYVDAPAGSFTVSVSLSHLSGGNKGLAAGDPHVDLFVYDPANPTGRGEPTIVGRATGLTGAPSVSVTVPEPAEGEPRTTPYVVVAKLVNVPGGVNGMDIQANFDLTVDVTAAAGAGQVFTVEDGSRTDDGTLFTGGQTNQVDLTVTNPSADAEVRDVVPASWNVKAGLSNDVDRVEGGDGGPQFVYFTDEATAPATEDDTASAAYTYFVEAPTGLAQSNAYTFGPAEARAVGAATDDPWTSVPNTTSGDKFVVGVSQSGEGLPSGEEAPEPPEAPSDLQGL